MKKVLLATSLFVLVFLHMRSWCAWYDAGQSQNLFQGSSQNIAGATQKPVSWRSMLMPKMDSATQVSYSKDKMLNGAMQQLRRKGDVALQKVVNLLNTERHVINLLLDGYRGNIVEQAVCDRDIMVGKSSPVVRSAYDRIMNLACYEPNFETKLQRSRVGYSDARFYRALSRSDSRAFLNNMLETIDTYTQKIRTMQWTG